MPRKPIDYSKTIIYKIVCKDLTIKDCYVGHTTDFRKRKNQHKSICKNKNSKKYNLKVYKFIRENKGWDNWDMVLIEKYNCVDGEEARKKERYWYEELNANLNCIFPSRTQQQYIEDNKEEIKNYLKEYYENNKERIKEHRKNNKEEIRKYQKEYQQNNKEKIKQIKKEYREINKEKIKEKTKEYYENNKEKIKEKTKEYYENNIEKLKQKKNKKVLCECGKIYTHQNKARHQKSKQHQQWQKIYDFIYS